MSLINTARREKEGEKEPTRSFSKKQENTIAKRFGGERVKNSGATFGNPGDVTTDQFLIECKTKMTHSQSITIQKSWLEKIKQEALFVGKPHTALLFNFGPDEKCYAIIEESLFEELQTLLKNNCM